MNKAYRVVWNAANGVWQVASELARLHGGRDVAACAVLPMLLLAVTPAWADGGAGGDGFVAVLQYGVGGAAGTAAAPDGTNGTDSLGIQLSDDTQVGGGGGGGGGGVSLVSGAGGAGGTGGAGLSGMSPTPSTGGSGGNGGAPGLTATIDANSGVLTGGAGGAGGAPQYGFDTNDNLIEGGGGGGGGGGGFGLVLTGAGASSNGTAGVVQGGNGGSGAGPSDNVFGGGGGGGAGGGGLLLTGSASYSNAGALQGGDGGAGADTTAASSGAGGDGGAGAVLTAGGGLANTGATASIAGGAGARGGSDSDGGNSANGGAGGDGVLLTNAGTVSNTGGAITGGGGGAGGAAPWTESTHGLAGAGGQGGAGIQAYAGATVENATSSTITGGDGGNGGAVTAIPGYSSQVPSGNGGSGGAGLLLAGGGTVTNAGVVKGGNGGAAGVSEGTNGSPGAGGAGISGSNLTITNSGTISGGYANAGSGAQADAIQFTGGSNTLTLQTGSTLNGAIELGTGGVSATIGAAETALTLGDAIVLDDGNAALTLNSINNLAVDGTISGSGAVTVTGTGVLTLAGANTYTGGTTITSGTLAISSDGNLGNASGGLTLNGGTLQTTAGVTSSRTVTLGANGGTIDTAGHNDTIGGTIGGSGTLTVASSTNGGSLTLTGTNAYTGATTINNGTTLMLSGSGSVAASSNVTAIGTLDISDTTNGASIKSLAGTGNVTLGSQTLTLTNASGSFSGVISGSGGLTLAGGTETLTNISTYTGTTQIDSGTTLVLSTPGDIVLANVVDEGALQISGSIENLSGNGTVTTGSQGLQLTGSNGTFGGVIAGSGGLTLSGGTQTLIGTNTYTGTTTVNHGATLALSGSGSVAASSGVTDNGTLDISGTTNGASITNIAGSGTVTLGNEPLTITDANGTFGGAFTGSGKLTVQGSGSLILGGDSASFTGTTTVASGLLEVGDVDTPLAVLGGDVTVDAAGTLRGHGTVAGNVTNNGTVMPGGSIGTLTVGGNYTQASSATLSIEVSPTQASQLKVDGTASLGGTLAITYDPGTYSAKTYTLVSAGSVSGTFGSVTSTGTANLGKLVSSLDYGADAVELVLAAPSTPSAPSAPLVVAPTDTSIYTAVGTTAILGAQAQGAALLERLGSASFATAAQPYGWIDATGSQTKVGGTNGEPGFQADRYGFLAGLDQKLGDYTLGIAAGYDHADIDEQGTGDSGTTDTLRASVYGARYVGPVNLAATLGLGLDFLSQKRPFGSQGTAEGDHMGQDVDLGGQASLPMTFGSLTVTPQAGLRYAYFHANGFDESGSGGEDLNVGTDNVHSLQPYVGVTIDKAFGDALRPVNAELRLGYAHEMLDSNRAVNVTSQDGTLFTAPGTSLPRGYLTAGASMTLHPKKDLDVSLSYDTVINTTHASAQVGDVRIGYRF